MLARSRELRRNSTDAERLLWRRLRNRQLRGAKFRRQRLFGPYILDFYSIEHGLAVEADGGQHHTPDGLARDAARDRYLRRKGVRVLRFSDSDIPQRIENVLEAIEQALVGHAAFVWESG